MNKGNIFATLKLYLVSRCLSERSSKGFYGVFKGVLQGFQGVLCVQVVLEGFYGVSGVSGGFKELQGVSKKFLGVSIEYQGVSIEFQEVSWSFRGFPGSLGHGSHP